MVYRGKPSRGCFDCRAKKITVSVLYSLFHVVPAMLRATFLREHPSNIHSVTSPDQRAANAQGPAVGVLDTETCWI
jgi:hypothetical protein